MVSNIYFKDVLSGKFEKFGNIYYKDEITGKILKNKKKNILTDKNELCYKHIYFKDGLTDKFIKNMDNIYYKDEITGKFKIIKSNNTKITKEKISKPNIEHTLTGGKTRKEKIPVAVKNTLWSLYFENNIQGNCQCCKTENISKNNFDCGHIISEKNGGKVELENLKPICRACNSSMSTNNMNEFMIKYGFDKIKIQE
jgi:5-methylcytosine-specific restriction endonuclease McrA